MIWIGLLAFAAGVAIGAWHLRLATYHLVTVDDGKLYRDGVRSMREFSTALRKTHARTVVRLIDADEQQSELFRAEADLLRSRGVEMVPIPVKLGGWPTTDDVRQFLSVATDAKRQPVLVHCAQGVRRTGMMAAAYQESILGYGAATAKMLSPSFGHSPRTTGDIARFIDIYDPQARAVTQSLPQSQE